MTLHANTVDGVLRRSAARHPDRAALTFDGRTHTYRDLDDAVSRAAGYLVGLGLIPGDRVATYGANSDAYVVAFLACARAGLVHVPVNHALVDDELRYVLTHSGARAVLADPHLISNLDTARVGADVDHVVPLPALLDVDDHGPAESPSESADLAQLLYTSGTTAKLKGAMMSHGALIAAYTSAVIALDLHEDDAPLVAMPLYHAAGMHVFTLPYLAVGATVSLMSRPDVCEILHRIERDRHGSLFLAPTVWVPLSNHPDLTARDLSSLTKAQYGASLMPVTVLNRLRDALPTVGFYNCFGQTEIGPLATVLSPREHDARPASCGRPVFFVEARVVDAAGADVADGEPGEVVYRSPHLCDGYWGDPEATAEAFRDGWFHSGDLVTRDADGYLTVVDRIKDVINTGGVLVAARDVEDAIYTHPSVAEVAVIGVPDDK